MSVFPRFLLFYRVFEYFSAMGVQKYHKNFVQKNRVEKRKGFTKNSIKKSKADFVSNCFITFLGVSRRGEFENSIQKISKKCLRPWSFFGLWPSHLPLALPRGSPTFVLAGPLAGSGSHGCCPQMPFVLFPLLIALKGAMGLWPFYIGKSCGANIPGAFDGFSPSIDIWKLRWPDVFWARTGCGGRRVVLHRPAVFAGH
jgi:hypothetical protein